METKEYFEKVMFFENLPSMVFTPPSVPPFPGDRSLRSEGENRPPVLYLPHLSLPRLEGP